MLAPTKAILLMFFAYLAGSIPFGYIIAFSYGSIDIREHGSGNIGMTNVFRTLGFLPGIVTLFLDAFKGYIVVYLSLLWIPPNNFGNDYMIWGAIICMIFLLAVVGHSYPIWLSFKGGKSVAISLGILAALMNWWILVPIFVFVLIVAITRYVSLGSILSAISVPVIFYLFRTFPYPSNASDNIFIGFTLLLAVLVIMRHKSNIKRLLTGTENRLGSKKKKPPDEEAITENNNADETPDDEPDSTE
ncbi:glycerol-3-phosphate 1-O-acyltransferase PlsY [bacterium]|nr:glycerol-3-phosphate 1-O-acyltransferase PlsY [bacterium]